MGETALQLNKCFNWHKTGTTNPDNHGHCHRLTYDVQILKKLDGDVRTEHGALDFQVTSYRKSRETHWMLALCSVYSHGLKDCIGNKHKSTSGVTMIGSRFPSLK